MPMSTFRVACFRALALALIVAAACTDAPSSPASAFATRLRDDDAEREPREAPNGHAGSLVRCVGRGPVDGEAVIGPEGGVLKLGPNSLRVPPGALRRSVTIRARVLDTIAAIAFEPHGLRFERPAALTLNTAGCAVREEQHPVLLYLDDDGEARETIGGLLDDRKHEFHAPIVHFSVYAIGI